MDADRPDPADAGWLASFLLDMPYAVVAATRTGKVRWCNAAAEALLDAWGPRTAPARLSGEIAAALSAGHRHHILLGEEGDPAFDMVIGAAGDIWLQARGVNDAISEQIRSTRRTKSAFLANMSHELRTPLNAILGYSELLAEEARERGAASMLTDIDRVHRSAAHLLRLINDILDVSKIEAGRVGLFLETFRIMDLVDDVVKTVAPLVQSNHNRLRLEVDTPATSMRADRTKLRQLLFNLLDNACKFTRGGEIVLRVEGFDAPDGAPCVSFTVEDTGIGMSDAQMSRLFEPFSQADTSTTRRFGGTGLGLALCRLLAHLMGGDIRAASTLGEGSVFTVTLPVVVEATGLRHAESDVPAKVHGAGDSTVLVIDDDPTVRDLLTRFLVKEGYRVVCAADGESGVELARELRPDAITLDVMMPRVDGWETLRRIKADPVIGGVPVVMLSIVDNTGLGFALGASDYLTKPIDRQALLKALAPFRGQVPGSVLVVDDHADIRDVLARTLRRAGWTVYEAASGEEALQFLEGRTPNVVVLDLLMPGIDGFEVVERMRRDARWQSVPILVVTAKDLTPADRLRLHGGVERVVSKSSRTLELLMHELQGVMDAKGGRRDASSGP